MAIDAEQRRKQPLLSAVIPFLNEEECIPALIAELDGSLTQIGIGFELVLVDDGSRDHSFAVAKEELRKRPHMTATIISLSRNLAKKRHSQLAWRRPMVMLSFPSMQTSKIRRRSSKECSRAGGRATTLSMP